MKPSKSLFVKNLAFSLFYGYSNSNNKLILKGIINVMIISDR